MGLLGKIFGGGGGATIDNLGKAVKDQRFVDARLLAETLASQSLTHAELEEVELLRSAAGDGLARLNLDEAVGLKRCGHNDQADEHFQLALEQVCSADLRAEIEGLMAAQAIEPEIDVPETASPASCFSCSPGITTPVDIEMIDTGDQEYQLELILTSYPSELIGRYQHKGEIFLEAFLLSHAGNDEQALPLWEQVEEKEQDDLYFFELGSLLARLGQLDGAEKYLEAALLQNQKLLIAVEALIPLLTSLGGPGKAEERLYKCLDQDVDPAFCHAQLASLLVQQGKVEKATDHARLGLAAGNTEPSFMLLAASVVEHSGQIDEAEGILQKLPVAGCGGGVNLALAEFWLRHDRELGRILDTFNAACREDPQNPRWQLRVAQTYLARNWQKDGLKLLKKVVGDPRLDSELAQEAEQLLEKQLAG